MGVHDNHEIRFESPTTVLGPSFKGTFNQQLNQENVGYGLCEKVRYSYLEYVCSGHCWIFGSNIHYVRIFSLAGNMYVKCNYLLASTCQSQQGGKPMRRVINAILILSALGFFGAIVYLILYTYRVV